MNKIIDYKELEVYIVTLEEIFREGELSEDEVMLVLNKTKGRLLDKIQKRKMSDMTANVPLGGLMGRVMKGLNKDE